mmetsp:Transcript_70624/g.132162  ORF Transcript_70624/g.132162 Transcript_70624/m.132162 type:complete len:405 (+) Transcript_70624:50-1264(+)
MLHTLACVALLIPVATGISCLDEAGSRVDWWFMIKRPQSGEFVYMTSATSQTGVFEPGSQPVTDSTSLLGKELAQIYDGSIKNYIFYNDELPNGTWTEEYGHTKGFLGWDDSTAFWVQHSVPKFPNFVSEGYLYGQGQEIYGQHAFCMTMSTANIDELATVMQYSDPLIYDYHTDGSLQNIEDLLHGKVAESGTIIKDIALPWGSMRLFGKTSAAYVDMMNDVIAPNFKSSMLSQSWLNSGEPFGSTCPKSGYDVFDVAELQLPPSETHDTHKDHSKWAVEKATTVGDAFPYACGIDNNHVHSQLRRAGLAACMQELGLSKALRSAAMKITPCGGPSPTPAPPSKRCCFYHDDSCSAGTLCCSATHRSYQSEKTCMQYGAPHRCRWTGSECVVPSTNDVEAVVV